MGEFLSVLSIKFSTEIDQLAKAMVMFQKEVGVALKEATAKIPTKNGGEFSYNYSTLEGVWDAAREKDLLSKCGLALSQDPSYAIINGEPHDTLVSMLAHESGQWKCSEMLLRLRSLDSQGHGSALTYNRRYAMCSILGIVQSDDDGAQATEQQRSSSTSSSGMPPCPVCGKQLRQDKINAKKRYCWTNTGGCGYDSTREETVTDASTGEITNKADALDLEEWDKMLNMARGNGWEEKTVQDHYDKVLRQGGTPSAALANCKNKFGKAKG